MNRYQRIKKLGDGTYGEVYLAQISDTNEIVAIKKMKRKYYSWDECLKLREIEALRKLSHPNIIKLKEVIRENDELFMIFEYMKENLYDYLKRKVKLNNATVKHVTYQVLLGLKAMHQKGFFHRDMKPENLLLNDNGQDPPTVKIADFGLARNIRSKPPYTDYVSTRWYRAPEVLLQSRNYSAPIDVWAVGCIVPELFTGRPLFPGSSEIDQLHKLCNILGTFTQQDWPEGVSMSKHKFPQYKAVTLESIIPTAEPSAIQLIDQCLKWNPAKRAKANDLLNCSWFSNMRLVSFPSANSATKKQDHANGYGSANPNYPIPARTAGSEGRRAMQGAAAAANANRNAQTHPSGDLGSSHGGRGEGDSRPQAPPTFGENKPKIQSGRLSKNPKISDDFDEDEFSAIFNIKPEKRQRTELASLFGSQKENTMSANHRNQLPPINTNSRRDSATRYYETNARYKPQQNPNQASNQFRDLNSGNHSGNNNFMSSFNHGNSNDGNSFGGLGSNPSAGGGIGGGGGYKPGFGGRRNSGNKQGFMQGAPSHQNNKPLIGAIGGPSLIDKYHPYKF
ncbi:serine/threonine-protein kinase dyf-5-like [Symsagittifera roscoffensis]|uniref:serine/threonine-protein kinase dyf-5-like n=1 Tax=Symsagittifera roscoffensis TaxID=84072 RepID=UPI00307BD7C8